MRPGDTLLLLGNLLTFGALVLPRLRAVRWMGYSAPFVFLVAIAQVLIEGAIWEMVPAYTLTIVFVLIWLFKNIRPTSQPADQKRIHRFIFGLAIGMGVLGLAISIALPFVFPVFHFPLPSGTYAIGTVTYRLTDTSRSEIFSSVPSARRELMIQVWYPARNSPSSPRAPYVQTSD